MPGPALRAPAAPPDRASRTRPPGRARAAWLAAAWRGPAPDNRHSRRVALLKRVLPAIGVALLLLIAMWPRLAPLWERMRLAFPAIDLREARQLRMINPRYAGVDRLGRPFVVTAAVGRQVPDRQDLMSLEAPRADMKTHSGADVVVTAATGIYQSQAQLLDLFGEVTLVASERHPLRHRHRAGRCRQQRGGGHRPGRGARPVRRCQGAGVPDPRQGRHDHLHRQVRLAAQAGEAGYREERAGRIAGADRGDRGAGRGRGEAGARGGGAGGGSSGMRRDGRRRRMPTPAPASWASSRCARQADTRQEARSDAAPAVPASRTSVDGGDRPRAVPLRHSAVAARRAQAVAAERQSADPDPGRFGDRVAAGRASLYRPRQRRRDPRPQRSPRRYADRPLPRGERRQYRRQYRDLPDRGGGPCHADRAARKPWSATAPSTTSIGRSPSSPARGSR